MENFCRSETIALGWTEDIMRKNDSGYTIRNTFTSTCKYLCWVARCLQI